jgi:hypothetical protein
LYLNLFSPFNTLDCNKAIPETMKWIDSDKNGILSKDEIMKWLPQKAFKSYQRFGFGDLEEPWPEKISLNIGDLELFCAIKKNP